MSREVKATGILLTRSPIEWRLVYNHVRQTHVQTKKKITLEKNNTKIEPNKLLSRLHLQAIRENFLSITVVVFLEKVWTRPSRSLAPEHTVTVSQLTLQSHVTFDMWLSILVNQSLNSVFCNFLQVGRNILTKFVFLIGRVNYKHIIFKIN